MTNGATIPVVEMEMGGAAAAPVASEARGGRAAVPDGEVVVLKLKPHALFVVLNCFGTLAALLVLSVVLRVISGWEVRVGAATVRAPEFRGAWRWPLIAGLALVAWQIMEWMARTYLLTDRRVVRVSGVVRQLTVEIPLARVQNVVLYRSVRERIFGLGTIGVSCAASGELSYVFWPMVARPGECLKIVRETVARYGGTNHGHQNDGGAV